VPQERTDELRGIARRAMLEYGLEPYFPPAALAQLRAIAAAAIERGPAIRDLTTLPWCSIDNDDSRDLDQLSVAEPLEGGAVRIRVAVADVDATVVAGSPLDAHARTNTTSVYTPAEVFALLPERLSSDLTSLTPGKERLSVVIEMTLTAAGRLHAADLYRAIVVNRAKLAYDSVAAWLEGHAAAPPGVAGSPGIDRQLRLQDAAAQLLKRGRRDEGALELSTPEAQPVRQGARLLDLRPAVDNRAKELIEYFMIAANGIVADFLEARGRAALRRVLPEPRRWDRIVQLAEGCGARLPAAPDGRALSAFLEARRRAAPERFPDLSLSVVKLLGAASYILKRPGEPVTGHFGLALGAYTHATAPNRRYPDLLMQRLLKAALSGADAPYDDAELRALAGHCTDQESNAAKVERRVRKSAAAMLLESHIGDRFDAIVTGASAEGTWVRIARPFAEGRVVKGFAGLDVGDGLHVQLIHTDVQRGFIDFARLD
jgi:VacB/RNase II family 3'-5' exoribonuclease